MSAAPRPRQYHISTPIVEDEALFLAVDEYLSNLSEGFSAIKADDLNEALASGKPLFLVDVRSSGELDFQGYFEGAVNIPLPVFISNLDKLPAKDQSIVIYYGSGHRGALAMSALRHLDYTTISNLAGGLNAWVAAEHPLATP